ncbi:hypothetical protein GCM10018781_46110 [Kitasatospora indigofera]|uniref:Uncharacterized protein n=1 Tax=Kitasatospora indigofera TaxID=67307 RepID=A0A919G113_9ACTN|nr:energy-coupling factor transporter transmembrane protein EcfT [Kitasatospora indigofera]GHH75966.1 hypothetical protein GCM10018781_46110 [Kitasatospora indigofera]
MVDGEWWRLNGPRRGDGGGGPAKEPAEPGEGGYLPPAAAVPAPAPPADPPAARVPAPPSSSPPPSSPSLSKPSVGPSARPGGVRWQAGGGFADWDDVHIDFSAVDEPEAASVPEPRDGDAAPGAADAAAAKPSGEQATAAKPAGRGRAARKAAKEQAARRGTAPAARPGLLAGRRPAPLLLVASALLVGGAVTRMVLVMLVGWALAYLSRSLGDRSRKFAVLGIPLLAVTGLVLWFWGRGQGKWGPALQPGEQLWAAAPGVLRLAAVLSAVYLLVVTVRRRGQ